ncbi:DUF1127 domain-containing protein [Variovorax sp. J22R133]|uniref:DUF1127 domain-containing protein n=1 Tax=Variovorax brevis TaxID=3053503 RepID=UPI002577488B|nr:DUF1127 domain-containing protein [Variovorax sp. J22R133]MDM0117735.1 DUF1127 domain-containing protein [Variovorax sp. J22R133]
MGWTRERFADWRRARRAATECRALHALDDLTLKDVGLDRSQIESWVACGDTDRRAR